ncbi:MAG TPA: hypothetical protein VKQ54_01035 [Caulobacteraceae bacterium]|nr:hypothetical protein [Caulobacteraceae bacterium]
MDIDNEQEGLPPLESVCGHPMWSDLSQRLSRLSAQVRVQANAHAVPALATLLMQGLVL